MKENPKQQKKQKKRKENGKKNIKEKQLNRGKLYSYRHSYH